MAFFYTCINRSILKFIVVLFGVICFFPGILYSSGLNLYTLNAPTISAGPNASSCGTRGYVISGSSATSYSILQWSTSGTGTFSNTTSITPTYTPSVADVNSGQVTLTLTAYSTGYTPALVSVDEMILTLIKEPTAYSGADATSCSSHSLIDAKATDYSSILWTTNGTGTFSNPTSLNPTYYPSNNDVRIGGVVLTLTVNGKDPCNSVVSDQMVLTLSYAAACNAGRDESVCEGSPVTLTTASGSSYNNFSWSSNGSGTLLNTETFTPTYIPSAADALKGSVTLTLFIVGRPPCNNNSSDAMIITIVPKPIGNAGNDIVSCSNTPVYVENAIAQNFATINWTSSGSGVFVDDKKLKPTYIPSSSDIENGSINLTMTIKGLPVCSQQLTDDIKVTFIPDPIVDAGENFELCDASAYFIDDAKAINYSTLSWSSSGTGTFLNGNTITPTYIPSLYDVSQGYVDLTIIARANSSCPAIASDVKRLFFTRSPIASAGPDEVNCGSNVFKITRATAQNSNLITWKTSGTGTFDNQYSLNPSYFPSAADISSGSVTLTITASPNKPCLVPATDDLILTLTKLPISYAGEDITSCEGSIFLNSGYAENFSSILWTSSGTGYFTNPGTINPTYHPSKADMEAGSAKITLTVFGKSPCSIAVTDFLTITLVKEAVVDAGVNSSICINSTFEVTTATSSNHNTLTWATSGSGTFSNQNTLNPIYTPGLTDILNGTVTLTLTATSSLPCYTSVRDEMELTINSPPTANAGFDQNICVDDEAYLDGSIVNSSVFKWSTNGDGKFNNASTLTPTYIPGINDISKGSVTIELIAYPQNSCASQVVDQMIIYISRPVEVYAGPDEIICSNTYKLLNATSKNFSSVSWTTTGTGSFINPNSVTTTYIASSSDIAAGSVVLSLTGFGITPCILPSTDYMTLQFIPEPVVNTGADVTICSGQSVVLVNASSSGSEKLLWSTSGSGSFSNPYSLNTIYYPGTDDLNTGSVILTLTGKGPFPCNLTSSDNTKVTIAPNPIVNAGTDDFTCDIIYNITRSTASNYSSVRWTTSGTGTFSNAFSLRPTYSPSDADRANGSVILTLIATGVNPCVNQVTDNMKLIIGSPVIANAGRDESTCGTTPITITTASSSSNNFIKWITSGTGTFSNQNTLYPTYIPSISDVATGSVTLTLQIHGGAPCFNIVEDQLVLEIISTAIINAGIDAQICEGNVFTVSTATALNYRALAWTTSGSGTLSGAGTVSPTYIPSIEDYKNGSVKLSLIGISHGPCSQQVYDEMLLSFSLKPTANAGPDQTICKGSSFAINGASVSNTSIIRWTTNGTGSIVDANTISPTYIPSLGDAAVGSVTLTLSVQGQDPCLSTVTDNLQLNISSEPLPKAYISGPIDACNGQKGVVYSVTPPVQYATSYNWTLPAGAIIYSGDKTSSIVVDFSQNAKSGTIQVEPFNQCGTGEIASIEVNISSAPPALSTITGQTEVCAGSSGIVYSVVPIEGIEEYKWTLPKGAVIESGDRTSSIVVTFTNSAISGIITVSAQNACGTGTASILPIKVFTFGGTPIVNAGADTGICEGQSFVVNDATASGYTTLIWTTSGTGFFINESSLTPTYVPSNYDKLLGSVNLTLSASGNPCSIATDIKVLTISPTAVVVAGPDATICRSCSHIVSGAFVNNASSYIWTSTGSGTITNANSLTPTYTPSAQDILKGSVTLILNAVSSSGCGTFKDQMELYINQNPDVDFTWEGICHLQPTNFFIDEKIVQVNNIVSWNWNFGDGFYSNVINPAHTYATPGSYIVTLTMIDVNGKTSIEKHEVTIQSTPTASFSIESSSCHGVNTHFTDLSSTENGFITTYIWNYGDGSTEKTVLFPNDPNVSHNYASPGDYDVSLTIVNSLGCENIYTNYITVTPSPVANFQYEPACLSATTQFSDASFVNGGSNIVKWDWNFGDPKSTIKNQSDLKNPAHVFNQPGNYNVTLTITNSDNCTSSITRQVLVIPTPRVSFIVTGKCLDTPVSFKPDPSFMDLSNITSFSWNFGDGSQKVNTRESSHVYTIPGAYEVTLTVSNANGCTGSYTRRIIIESSPVALFSFEGACLNNMASFTDLSFTMDASTITSWQWKFNDAGASANSDASTLRNPGYTFSAAGTYQVTLTATNSNGCASNVTLPVQVREAPIAKFTYLTSTCDLATINFIDQSSSANNDIATWNWEFESNKFSNLQNPTHTFSKTNENFNVKLSVTDQLGCANSTSMQVKVPAATKINIEHLSACIGTGTSFNPVIVSGKSQIITYSWNFGDPTSGVNNTSSYQNPVHLYQNPGSYNVSLTTTDINNCVTTSNTTIDIIALPIPMFSHVVRGCDSTVYFKDQSNANGNTIAYRVWDFGDGSIDTITVAANISHFYINAGQYKVTITNVTTTGCYSTYSKTIYRLGCVEANFEQDRALACENKSISFSDRSVSVTPIEEWTWNFGDGKTESYSSHQSSVEHVYTRGGTYTVNLIVSTASYGQTIKDTIARTVKVSESPVASYQVSNACLGSKTIFSDQSSYNKSGILKWQWYPGDSPKPAEVNSQRTISYAYQSVGTFNSSLIVTNSIGCSDTVSRAVNVNLPPKANFSHGPICQNNQTAFVDESIDAGGSINKWRWMLNNSVNGMSFASTSDPKFIFRETGEQEVRLVVMDENGCADSTARVVTVNPTPTSAFDYTENYDNTQGRLLFTNASIGATSYVWDFGMGVPSEDGENNNPVVDFKEPGSYMISLISYSEFDCPDTLTMSYSFTFKGLWVPNAFSPNNPNEPVRIFKPVGINLKTYQLTIYDSWGNALWTTAKLTDSGSPAEGWDGTYKGNLMPQDTYLYKISAVFTDGTIWDGTSIGKNNMMHGKTHGTLHLIR